MTVKAHKGGLANGDIVGYILSGPSVFYGYKLLKEVWVDDAVGHVWLAQPGEVRDGVFTTMFKVIVLSQDDLKSAYTDIWTEDAAPEYVKGDILEGTEKISGDRVVLLYVSDRHVERLTPYAWYGEQGWASLAHFQEVLKDIKFLTARHGGARFSAL